MMAMMYASAILRKRMNRNTRSAWTFADVPATLKDDVADILINDSNHPELVPVEYGGTAE